TALILRTRASAPPESACNASPMRRFVLRRSRTTQTAALRPHHLAPILLSAEWERLYAADISRDSGDSADWRLAHVAVQQWIGLLSERWARSGHAGHADSVPDGPGLIIMGA